mmetsp:Transcript_48870/g.116360  ORF Transcript_48870/g.116360 Transcript_48870/m.116360 type:complete len:242 (-) Transcript_48870:32-757(-)
MDKLRLHWIVFPIEGVFRRSMEDDRLEVEISVLLPPSHRDHVALVWHLYCPPVIGERLSQVVRVLRPLVHVPYQGCQLRLLEILLTPPGGPERCPIRAFDVDWALLLACARTPHLGLHRCPLLVSIPPHRLPWHLLRQIRRRRNRDRRQRDAPGRGGQRQQQQRRAARAARQRQRPPELHAERSNPPWSLGERSTQRRDGALSTGALLGEHVFPEAVCAAVRQQAPPDLLGAGGTPDAEPR